MGKLFGNVQGNVQLTQQDMLQRKYNTARSNLLLAIAFTVINIILLFMNSTTYFLFSLFMPYYLALEGFALTGKLPPEFYGEDLATLEFLDSSFLVITLVIAAVILLFYLACWFFSNKRRVGWLVVALVVFCLDTILLFVLSGDLSNAIFDIVFHVWVVVSLISGISANNQLKKLPVQEVVVNEVNEGSGNESVDNLLESTVYLRRADQDVKSRVLAEARKDGYAITYRRVKKTNELVINGYVYDEYVAVIENVHNLVAVIDNHAIEAGFDGVRSYIKVDGEVIAKKIRLA